MKIKKKFIWVTAVFFMLATTLWLARESIVRSLFYPRMAKPYQSALQRLKDLGTAESEFLHQQGRYGTLQELAEKGFIPVAWATGKNAFYRFDYQLKDNGYEAFATPQKCGTDTNISFYLSSLDWRVRGADKKGEIANANDPIYTN